MKYRFVPMKAEYAKACDQWRYDPPYDFYDLNADEEDRKEFLDPGNWGIEQYVVLDMEEELVGFFSFKLEGDAMYIGLGMRPDLTGQGRGNTFVQEGILFGAKLLDLPSPNVVLEVADFNKRAISVYEKLGFTTTKRFTQNTNDGKYSSLRMERVSTL